MIKTSGIYLVVLLFVILLTPAGAQNTDNTSDLRTVTAAGPYPIYMTMQFSYAGKSNPMKDLMADFANERGLRGRRVLHGLQTNIGFVVNNNTFQGLTIETGVLALERVLKSKNDELRISEIVASARLGYYYPIYPFTLHAQLGPIFFHNSRIELSDSQDNVIDIHRDYKNQFIQGLDFRFRINILDPAGTGGGLGVFFEYMRHHNFKGRSTVPFYDVFTSNAGGDSKWSYNVWSIGLKASLALKL